MRTYVTPLPDQIDRWSPMRKAEVCAQVLYGSLAKADACAKFDLSSEELESWLTAYVKGGVRALRVTTRPKVQA